MRVDRIVVVVRSSRCGCLGDRVSLQLRAMSGDTWGDSQFVSGAEQSGTIVIE